MEGDNIEVVSVKDKEIQKDRYLKWTRCMDGQLLEVLKEQKAKGLKDDRNFQAAAYRAAVDALNNNFQLNITRSHIINRLKTLKDQMGLALELLTQKSGYSWNDITKKIQARSEVWADLIKAHPKYKSVKDRELYHLEILREIFEKDRATGSKAESAKEKVRRWEREEREIGIDDIDDMQTQNEVHLESFDNFETVNAPQQQGSTQFGTSSSNPSITVNKPKGKKRKALEKDQLVDEIKMMTDSLNNIATALTNTTDIKAKMEKVFAELTTMELEEDILFKAIDIFQSDPKLCDTFFACPMEMRARWLFRKISDHI